jgi:hypothetical protein
VEGGREGGRVGGWEGGREGKGRRNQTVRGRTTKKGRRGKRGKGEGNWREERRKGC